MGCSMKCTALTYPHPPMPQQPPGRTLQVPTRGLRRHEVEVVVAARAGGARGAVPLPAAAAAAAEAHDAGRRQLRRHRAQLPSLRYGNRYGYRLVNIASDEN